MKRATMFDASGMSTYIYDTRERLRTNRTPAGDLFYDYDSAGNQTKVWSSTGNGANFLNSFDEQNRLRAVTNIVSGTNSLAVLYGRDALGSLRSLRLGKGVTNLATWDTLNRLTNLSWSLNLVTLADFSYQLGASGGRTNLTEMVEGTPRSTKWQQDSLYRLTKEVLIAAASGTNTYSLDPVGNRLVLNATIPGTWGQTNAFDLNDRLGSDIYDLGGNTIGSGADTFVYDPEDHLIAVSVRGTSLTFVHDGDGIRVAKTVGGTTITYLVDRQSLAGYPQVLEENALSGGTTNLLRAYVYGMALISQREASGTTYYFVADGHGSTRLLLDEMGSVVNTFTYDAYGGLIGSNGPPQTAYLYSGEQFDPDLGMSYLRARYYRPVSGRFLTADPATGHPELPLSLHRYLYAADDPQDLRDPGGRDPMEALNDFAFETAGRWGNVVVQKQAFQGFEVITVPKTGGYDSTQVQIAAIRYAKKTGGTVLSVQGVSDANAQLRALPRPIDRLHIEGHGAGTGQWVGPVGDGRLNATFARLGLDGQPEFVNVNELFQGVKFAPKAEVWLRGCRVASDQPLWQALKKKIAATAGLQDKNVHAFLSDTRVHGGEGVSMPDEGPPQ